MAQTTKVVSVTRQHWRGGVAGRTGNNYVITINCTRFKGEAPIPDTLWIDETSVPLAVTNDLKKGGNTLMEKIHGGIRYEIHVGTVHDKNPELQARNNKNTAPPPQVYNGLGLLSLRFGGTRRLVAIEKVTDELKSNDYP